jgi:hypothetical protein
MPPFTGVAVNVTLAPRQIEVVVEEIVTDGITLAAVMVEFTPAAEVQLPTVISRLL